MVRYQRYLQANGRGDEVDDTIRYLNTDLDLMSADDLTALAAAFEARSASSACGPERGRAVVRDL